MEQIYDSRHSGQEVDNAVDAVHTTIPNQLTQIGSKLGNLAQLETEEKNNLVDAVNEVNGNIGSYVDNPEFIRVVTDNEGKILYGVKQDGEFFFGVGCPEQVREYIEQKIADLSLDEYEDIVAFLDDYLGDDATLKSLLDNKLDAEGLDHEALETVQAIENPEFIQVITDSENKILWAIKADGSVYYGAGVPSQVQEEIEKNIEDNNEIRLGDLDNLQTTDKTNAVNAINNLLNGVLPTYRLKIIDNSYVSNTNGKILAYNGWSRTDYTVCKGLSSINISNVTVNSVYNCFYDENKAFISSFTTPVGDSVIEVPANAFYFIASNTTASMNGMKIDKATITGVDELKEEVIYDVSARNADAKFASLSALLSSENLSTLIPIAVRCGGMSIRFVQTDNKYVQYRLMADEWSIDTEDWAIADEGVYVGNSEFVYVKTDKNDKILWAIKADGSVYYGAGVPSQVQEEIEKNIEDNNEIRLGDLDNLQTTDKTNAVNAINNLLNGVLPTYRLKIIDNSYVSNTNGKILAYNGWSRTDYTVCKGLSSINISNVTVNSVYNCFYDENKAFISSFTTPVGDSVIEVPANAFYFIASNTTASMNGMKIDKATITGVDELKEEVIYDVSARNADAKFASLSALLSSENLSTLIPIAVRCGGMSIRFVQTDNKYVQYRLMADEWSIDTEDWAIADEGVYVGNSEFVYVKTDKNDKILWAIKADGSVYYGAGVPSQITKEIEENIDNLLTDAYQLNKAQEQNLLAAARYNTTYGKCVQMLLVADSHNGFIGVRRAADICKNVPSVDAIMHLGDMVGWTPNELEVDAVAATVEILKTSKRPFFVVTGNHDVGTVKDIYFNRTHEQVYTDLVKPMIDNGILSNGEYQTTGDWSERCYYYHDFKTTKIRLIVLYDYDMDLVLDDNEYWEPVAYDSSKGKIERGTTYTYDPNNPIILNCGGWENNSFRLKKTVTTITSSIGVNNYTKGTFPWYKLRSFSYHSKKQMDWLANVLNTTPDGYGIVIASHQSPVFPAIISDHDFSIGSNPQNTYHPNSGVPTDTVMQTALAMKIVNAWKNKTSITERIVVKDTSVTTTLQNGDYLNNMEDGSGKYAYIFNADFSNRQNNNAYFINFVCGHEHCDIIEQSVDYPDLFCLATTTSNPPFRFKSDMPYIENLGSPAYDCLTVLTWAKDRNIACKWGCTRTIAGIDRSYVEL